MSTDKRFENTFTDGKVPLVLYSGGMDSTLLVYYLLLHGNIDTLYVSCNGTEGRKFKEKEARERARSVFHHTDNPLRLAGRIKKDHAINLDNTLAQVPSYKLVQPLAWLLAGLMTFDPNCHSELHVGYIFGDTAPVFSAELRAWWDNAYRLMHATRTSPPLRFPLIEGGYSKIDVLGELPHSLADKIWVCELPDAIGDTGRYRYCKTCKSCRTNSNMLADYKHKHGWDYGAWLMHCREGNESKALD